MAIHKFPGKHSVNVPESAKLYSTVMSYDTNGDKFLDYKVRH